MFENHLIKKSADIKTLPRGSKEPTADTRNIQKEDEKNEKKEEMEKGFLTHLKSQGLVPPKGTGAYGKHGADMHEHRSQMHASKKYTEAGKQADAGEGMRNLHKAMCPVMKGLQKLLKGLADKNNL